MTSKWTLDEDPSPDFDCRLKFLKQLFDPVTPRAKNANDSLTQMSLSVFSVPETLMRHVFPAKVQLDSEV